MLSLACCTCCSCCNSRHQQARTYFQVWDNRIEFNKPCSCYLCCTTSEKCVGDKVTVRYFDRLPARSGTCCFIPITCCGPPVIFASVPRICCVDLSDCCGQQIMAAPCNLYGCRPLCFCGPRLYRICSCPLVSGARDTGKFVHQWKGALDTYAAKHDLPSSQVAVFDGVVDALFVDTDD
jgi:hypothetical protein